MRRPELRGLDLIQQPVHVAGRGLTLLRPRDEDALLDAADFGRDEFIPYWASLWPSARALAEAVGAAAPAGRRVVELGCGLGLPSIVAALEGADVLATDWAPDALAVAAENARRNGAAVRTQPWRWDEPAPGRFELLLAADVLYEARNVPLVLGAVEAAIEPGGEAWIADPGRATAAPFLAAARERFAVDELAHGGPESVTVYRLLASA
jgi:predicted nicotinamide N-methyase